MGDVSNVEKEIEELEKQWKKNLTEWQEKAGSPVTHWMPLPEPPKEGKHDG